MSVPITLELSVSELSGKIRFGCTRSYSFLTFLKTPMVRMAVSSVIGNEKYKIRDLPQVSRKEY